MENRVILQELWYVENRLQYTPIRGNKHWFEQISDQSMNFNLPKPNLVLNSAYNHRSSGKNVSATLQYFPLCDNDLYEIPISSWETMYQKLNTKSKHIGFQIRIMGLPDLRNPDNVGLSFSPSSPFFAIAPKKNGRFSKNNEHRFLIFSFKIDILILLKILKRSKYLI